MPSVFRIQVFGKPGCEKCAVLNQRLDKLLSTDRWRGFDKEYCSMETVEGLVAFAESECVNPQRIPALVVRKLNSETGEYELMPAPATTGSKSHLHATLGLQTDYSDEGRGVISPKMLDSILQEAAGAAVPV